MNYPELYRERIIPRECIHLKDDTILFYDDSILITEWHALKPKRDLHHGYSCYFLKKGYKVSKFLGEDNSLLYWYCDIIDSTYLESENKLIVTDLLADVIIYPDGFVKVVDIHEIPQALSEGGLSMDRLQKALVSLGELLNIIYNEKFDTLSCHIEHYARQKKD